MLIHRFERWKHPVHTNKVFVAKFFPHDNNLLYTGSWDRSVKFWDIRADELIHTVGLTQICGDSVEMSRNGKYVVTGGGTMGEGIRMWDMRSLNKPVLQLNWESTKDYVNPTINVAKFAPISGNVQGCNDHDYIIAGARDEGSNLPVKCFSTETGEIVYNFKYVQTSCLTLDISQDG